MKNKMTVTEQWIESLRKQQEIAKAQGKFFDGTERDNIISLEKRKQERYEDTRPCECN